MFSCYFLKDASSVDYREKMKEERDGGEPTRGLRGEQLRSSSPSASG